MNRLYFDHNSFSPLRPQVAEAIREFGGGGNPSSIHGAGRMMRSKIDACRERLADALGAKPSEIIYTSGGTEANHLAWNHFSQPGMKIGVLTIEHSSVLGAAQVAAARGAEIYWIGVDRAGRVIEEDLDRALLAGLNFLSIHLANNETGVIYNVRDIALRARDQGVFVHTDAVQAFRKMEFSAEALGVHYLTVSGHKLGAPAGIGALYVRHKAPLLPLWQGGSQEKGRRTGTENALGIIGFDAAVTATGRDIETEERRLRDLQTRFEKEILNSIPHVRVTGGELPRIPNTSHLRFSDTDGESLLIASDLSGIECSAGSACSAGSQKPSHVLLSMGFSAEEAHGSLRFSFGWNNSREDISQALRILPEIITQVRFRGKREVEKRA